MIIPADTWMNQNNYVTTEMEQGAEQKTYDYEAAFANDPLLNAVVNSTVVNLPKRFYTNSNVRSNKTS